MKITSIKNTNLYHFLLEKRCFEGFMKKVELNGIVLGIPCKSIFMLPIHVQGYEIQINGLQKKIDFLQITLLMFMIIQSS